MSNRIYSSRLDFTPGWVVKDQRYAKPGAPSEMFNTQLDLLSEGALRQVWGSTPFAFWGTVGTGGQLKAEAAVGRRPGICHIANIKDGDDGEPDILVVVDQQKNGANTDTHFYWVTTPSTFTSQMNMIWGNTITCAGEEGEAITFYYADLVHVMGRERLDYPMTISMVSSTGTLAAYGADIGFSWTPPSPGSETNDEIEFELEHTETGETATLILDVTYGPAVTGSSVYYSVTNGNAFPDQTFLCTTSNTFTLYDTKYSPVMADGTWFGDKLTFSGGGNFIDPFSNPFVTYPIYDCSGGYTKVYWESTGASYTLELLDGYEGSTLSTPTMRHFLALQPTRAQEHKSTYLGQGTAMRHVHTVSNVTQNASGPLGIWSSATMNGKAFFFNGYSGTAFWMDSDNPASTGTIGLDRPAFTLTAIGTYTKPGSDNKNEPRKGPYRYWIAEINENGFESGISENYLQFTNDKYRTEGILIGTSTTASTDAITPASNTQSFMRLYRSFRNDYAPYHLADLDEYNTPYFEDNSADDSLGDPPWTHGDAPPYDAFSPVVYYDRLWLLGTRPGVTEAKRTTLFWSDINEPESFWWDGNWANVYGDDGDEVTAMVRDKTGLLIFKNNHTYLMSGRSPDEISFNEITVEDSDTGVGCPHQNAVVATDFGVFFYWNRGVYRYLQGQVQKVSGAISPILEGRQDVFTAATGSLWPYYGKPYGWSVTLDYDNVSQIVYFGCQGDFPAQLFNPSDVTETSTNEMTALLDVARARWIGMYSYHLGFIRRANVQIEENWKGGGETWQANMLIGAPIGRSNTDDLGYGVHHPIAIVPNMAGMGNMPINSKAKFRPIIGNLGPFSSKRFIAVDYLLDEQGIDYQVGDAAIVSNIYFDGSVTPVTSTLTVGGGPVYSDHVRHTLGLVGAEVEAEVVFDPNLSGDLIRMFEYSIAWQNLGREKAERPGAAPASPPGGPGWTSPPVTLGRGSR